MVIVREVRKRNVSQLCRESPRAWIRRCIRNYAGFAAGIPRIGKLILTWLLDAVL
jgi:hypothetical protein